jgi:hypothetical protein
VGMRSLKSFSKNLATTLPLVSTTYVPGLGMPWAMESAGTVSFKIPKVRMILESGSESRR